MGREEDLAGIEVRARSIRIRFMYRGKMRKETLYKGNIPMLPTETNVEIAKKRLKAIKKEIRDDTFVYAEYFPKSSYLSEPKKDVVMLFQIMDMYISLLEAKPSTKIQFQNRLNNFWKKVLKNQPITDVSYSDILTGLTLGTWKSGKSRNNEISLIYNVFEFARIDKVINVNPCEEVKRVKYQKPVADPFNLSEVQAILAYLRDHRHEQIWNFVQLMFFTGLRTSEGIALRWTDIDFRKKEVLIHGANVYGEEVDETKTFEARTVKLNALAVEALQRQKSHTLLAGEHVFHDPRTREPWAYAKITDVRSFWKVTLTNLGIRYRRPYSMRHTYATLGLMSGVKPGFMASQLGHNLEMFFKVYAKWLSGADDDREMAKLEQAIATPEPEPPLPHVAEYARARNR
jgi:integrase